MLGSHLKASVAIAAAVVLCVAAIITVYGPLHPAATTSSSPSSLFARESVLPSPAPLSTMAPQPWVPDWESVSGGAYAVPPNYSRTFPSGFGPPHAASLAELGTRPGCDPAISAADPSGPCGWGVVVRCDDNPWTPVCNQRLSNGTTCGFGLQDCIEAQLSCRLPITGGSTLGGFVSFPKGEFTPDPSSNKITMRGPAHHAPGVSYDRAYARWVPASLALISPNGSHYAYVDENWTVHDVGITDGSDRVVGPSGSWLPLAYADAGIYVVPFDPETGPRAGLWLFRANGSRAVSQSGYWSIVGGGAAYGHPTRNPVLSPDQLVRLDLGSGTSSPWFRRPNEFIDVIGFDGSGHPIVFANGRLPADVDLATYHELWLVTGRNTGVNLISGGLNFVPATISDTHGIWLWSSQGLYLLTVITDSARIPHPVLAQIASPRAQPAVGTCA